MLDVSKHVQVFNPNWVNGPIAIVGLGSLGCAVALNLAKLGITSDFYLIDDDVVEAHNISNQCLYGISDIGRNKTFAAGDTLSRLTDGSVDRFYSFTYKVGKSRKDLLEAKYVFVCVDSMKARKDIFRNCVYMNPNVSYFSEGRMNAREGMVYGFNPQIMEKAIEYLDRLYPDEEVDVNSGGCSITQSIGSTSMTLACQMVWHFMDALSGDITRNPPDEIALRVPNISVYNKGQLIPTKKRTIT